MTKNASDIRHEIHCTECLFCHLQLLCSEQPLWANCFYTYSCHILHLSRLLGSRHHCLCWKYNIINFQKLPSVKRGCFTKKSMSIVIVNINVKVEKLNCFSHCLHRVGSFYLNVAWILDICFRYSYWQTNCDSRKT